MRNSSTGSVGLWKLVVRGLTVTVICAAASARSGHAAAEKTTALGVSLQCEAWGRTKACPEFLLGFVDANPYLRQAPRSDASILMFVTTTSIGNDDHLHFRVIGTVASAANTVEFDTKLDTRATDDEVRSQLQPAFARGVALFVAAAHPAAVEFSFTAPPQNDGAATPAAALSPWDFRLSIDAYGNRSNRYSSTTTYQNISLARTTPTSINRLNLSGVYRVNKLPPLVIGDEVISLNTRAWSSSIGGMTEHQLTPHWAYAVRGSAGIADRRAQTRRNANAEAAIEWDHYPSNDPRGNQFAVAYGMGFAYERYNFINVLGERLAIYPRHSLGASGNFRRDRVQYALSANADAELLHPTRRYALTLEPSISWQVGSHIDLNVSVSVIKRAIPGPADVDETDADQLARAAYAEPLALSGSFGITVHWDRTNGARNNRFSTL
ncbi:MAG: hypothetical protein KBG15_09925 [Kofleriaceae bacterium]|nr:hypothetical protein [Kofleriaceae bacterium]